MLRKSLMINPADNVAMVLEDAKCGDTIETPKGAITLVEDVEFAHKVCLCDLNQGDKVYKYGEEIGYMLVDVKKGSWIHNHVMGCDRGR